MPVKFTKRFGDTMIEVLIALSVFGLISILSINLMNNGTNTAESSLENTMVRNEVNAQAEALRFVHGAVTAGVKDQKMTDLWSAITQQAISAGKMEGYIYPPEGTNSAGQVLSCQNYYLNSDSEYLGGRGAFVLNTRRLLTNGADGADKTALQTFDDGTFREASQSSNYARVIYKNDATNLQTNTEATNFAAAEGIWVIAVKSATTIEGQPQFYDFYIHTCWYNPGRDNPTTIGTVIRLYNPAEGGQ